MVTIKGKLIKMLEANGMFESQAKEVIELAIPKLNEVVKDYRVDFNDSEDTYPEAIYTVFFMSVKPIALNWINQNKPEAWYKPMFE
jgi:hypothetical protein